MDSIKQFFDMIDLGSKHLGWSKGALALLVVIAIGFECMRRLGNFADENYTRIRDHQRRTTRELLEDLETMRKRCERMMVERQEVEDRLRKAEQRIDDLLAALHQRQ